MKLPLGAIEVANPVDVLRAVMEQNDTGINGSPTSRAQRRSLQSNVAKDRDSPRSDHDRPKEPGEGLAAIASNESSRPGVLPSDGILKSSNERASRIDRRNADNSRRRKIKRKDLVLPLRSEAPNLSSMKSLEHRSYIECWLDDCIKHRPRLDELKSFAKGSGLEYVDLLGATCEDTFEDFATSPPSLPEVRNSEPGRTSFLSLMDKVLEDMGGYESAIMRGSGARKSTSGGVLIANTDDAAREDDAQEPKHIDEPVKHGTIGVDGTSKSPQESLPPNDLERAQRLAMALLLESRRADLMQSRVELFRTELVTVLKRLNIALEAVIAVSSCRCTSSANKKREQDKLLDDLVENLTVVHSGELVKQTEDRMKGLDYLRCPRRQKRSAGSEDDRDSQSSSSLNTSDIWSSESEAQGT